MSALALGLAGCASYPMYSQVGVGYYDDGYSDGYYGYGGYGGYGGWPGYDREVAVLIRDRATGQLLYEARASNNGASSAINPLLPAMFSAALKDFPAGGPNPRRVSVELPKPQ